MSLERKHRVVRWLKKLLNEFQIGFYQLDDTCIHDVFPPTDN